MVAPADITDGGKDRRDAPERARFPLEVRLLTDGTADGSLVYFNGVLQGRLSEFNLSLRAKRHLKLGGVRVSGLGTAEPFSFYGPGDMERFRLPAASPSEVIGAAVNT